MRNRTISAELVKAFADKGIAHELDTVSQTSMLSSNRLLSMIQASDLAQCVAGDQAEIGAGAGGTSRLMALLNPERTHWLCDTFVGLVDAGVKDGNLKNGEFAGTSLEQMKSRLAGLSNIRFVEGHFPYSAPDEMRDSRFAFVHLDVDTYTSMLACFLFFVERMSPGGVMVLDDVIGRGTPGAKLFWQETLDRPHDGWSVVTECDPHVVIRFTGERPVALKLGGEAFNMVAPDDVAEKLAGYGRRPAD